MQTVILDGTTSRLEPAQKVSQSLAHWGELQGWKLHRFPLAEMEIPPCQGEFNCWLRNPGECCQPGPHHEVTRAFIQSDLAIILTPLTFGGYSSHLKKAWDHLVPLALPYMTKHHRETHHQPRYPRIPSFLAVGFTDQSEEEAEIIFHTLVRRNVLNLHAPRFDSRIVHTGRMEEALAQLPDWMRPRFTSAQQNLTRVGLVLSPTILSFKPPRHALLLCGSPHGWGGNSASIGRYLQEKLEKTQITFQRFWLYKALRSAKEWDALYRGIEESDLVLLTAPLYVDSIPAPVIEGLEKLSTRFSGRKHASGPPLAAFVNSGFPEPVQGHAALASYRMFARETGMEWAGGLAIGAGEMLEGKNLQELGGRVQSLRKALDLTAVSLAKGMPVPAEAQEVVGRLPFPFFLYRLMGNWSFRRIAWQRKVLSRIRARPYS